MNKLDQINDLLDGIYTNSELGNVAEIKKLLKELTTEDIKENNLLEFTRSNIPY